jgi:hypothetical protein
MIKRSLALVLVVTITGCASVPLSTMWRLRNFTPQDVAILDPEDIGVAVQLPDELTLDEDRVTFNIQLFRKADDDRELALEERADLETVEVGQRVITPVPAARDGRHWHVLKLSEEALASFRRFQMQFQAFKLKTAERNFR